MLLRVTGTWLLSGTLPRSRFEQTPRPRQCRPYRRARISTPNSVSHLQGVIIVRGSEIGLRGGGGGAVICGFSDGEPTGCDFHTYLIGKIALQQNTHNSIGINWIYIIFNIMKDIIVIYNICNFLTYIRYNIK